MIRINLLGRDAEPKAKGLAGLRLPELSANANQIGIGAMLIGVLVLIAVAWWYQSAQLGTVRAELAAVEVDRERLEGVASQVETLQARTDVLREKLLVIVDLKANQTGPVMLLDQVSRLLTDGLWLTALELDDGDVDVRGSALSDASVADFIDNLERSQYFSGVRLLTLGDSGEQLNFQVTLAFNPTPGAQEPAADEAQAPSPGGGA